MWLYVTLQAKRGLMQEESGWAETSGSKTRQETGFPKASRGRSSDHTLNFHSWSLELRDNSVPNTVMIIHLSPLPPGNHCSRHTQVLRRGNLLQIEVHPSLNSILLNTHCIITWGSIIVTATAVLRLGTTLTHPGQQSRLVWRCTEQNWGCLALQTLSLGKLKAIALY